MKCCAEEHGHGYQCHNANLQNWRTIHGELLLYNLEDLNKMIYALRGRGASTTHVQKCCLPKTEFSGQKNFGLDMLPNLGSLVTRFHFSVNISALNSNWKQCFLAIQNLRLGSELKTDISTKKKRDGHKNPRGQAHVRPKFSYLSPPDPFQERPFQTCATPT